MAPAHGPEEREAGPGQGPGLPRGGAGEGIYQPRGAGGQEDAYEWEISHCERQLDKRRGEIAFLERLSNVVPPDELAEMAERARGYLDRMRNSEGLMELINSTYARLKTSMEEIVAFLDENE